jgi:hypothetical protein
MDDVGVKYTAHGNNPSEKEGIEKEEVGKEASKSDGQIKI